MIDKDMQINITKIFVKMLFKIVVTSHFDYQCKCAILPFFRINYNNSYK